VGVEGLPTLAATANAAQAHENGVGNRRLALLLTEEPDRRPRRGQEVLL